ncbi:MAG: hypothetical protein ACWA40_10415 [Planktomarina sp.]
MSNAQLYDSIFAILSKNFDRDEPATVGDIARMLASQVAVFAALNNAIELFAKLNDDVVDFPEMEKLEDAVQLMLDALQDASKALADRVDG